MAKTVKVRFEAEENVVGLFRKIMRPRQLRSEDIKKGREHIDIHSKGDYECSNCGHTWFSYYSWITFDLKEKRISKRWMMKCKMCLCSNKPYFDVEQIEWMINMAVDIYKGEYESQKNNNRVNGSSFERRQPHQPTLCEKCKWGEERCWLYKYRCQ